MELAEQVQESYSAYFDGRPTFLVRAPGRVNLIGEHTDYNDGFVLPMAIDRAVWIALRPRADRRVRVRSLDFSETAEFSLDDFQRGKGWPEYLKGVAFALESDGLKLRGWDGVISGDVPRGAGLSSSAAVEIATACAFAAASDLDWEPSRMARAGMRAENDWIGVSSGIMDQMVSAAAKEGHAFFLDCRSLEFQHIPLPHGIAVVVLDTSTRRGLADSAYNERRTQCEKAARFFKVKALRDVSLKELNERSGELEEVVLRRARHVITENQRVLDANAAMQHADAAQLGELFNASHASLRDDFEVSSEALNRMVECAQDQPGCYGARMTGAGFGGCAVALVDTPRAEELSRAVTVCYRQVSGLEPGIYICQASEGARMVSV